MEDDEQLADRTEHSLYVLAIAGLVRRLPQQLLNKRQLQLLSFFDPEQHLLVIILVGDGLNGRWVTKVVKSCI